VLNVGLLVTHHWLMHLKLAAGQRSHWVGEHGMADPDLGSHQAEICFCTLFVARIKREGISTMVKVNAHETTPFPAMLRQAGRKRHCLARTLAGARATRTAAEQFRSDLLKACYLSDMIGLQLRAKPAQESLPNRL
jgi:hypothetical protein